MIAVTSTGGALAAAGSDSGRSAVAADCASDSFKLQILRGRTESGNGRGRTRAAPQVPCRPGLDQNALDAAVVCSFHVLGHPVGAEQAVGHLDDDVIGLEQP